METTINQRISEFFKSQRLSDNAVARLFGMNQSTISRQLRGAFPINLVLLEAILNHFPGLSAEWLMRGKGEMLLHEEEKDGEKKMFATTNSNLWEKVVMALTDTCADQRKMIEKLNSLKEE